MTRTVVTLCLGDEYQALARETEPFVESYAAHYAGPGHGTEPKVAQIARDAAALRGRATS